MKKIISIVINVNFLLLTILFVIIQTTLLYGSTTGSLEGVVTDENTGKPLGGVNINILETQQGAATNMEGFFKIHNLRVGSYTVRISMIGYRKLTYKKISIFSDLRTKLSVKLIESVIELDALEVSAERPLIQTDVTGTAYDIGSKKIEKLPIGN